MTEPDGHRRAAQLRARAAPVPAAPRRRRLRGAGRLRRARSRASSSCRWCSTTHYRSKAEDNRISIVPMPPNRGLIIDRNGVVLARNYSGYTLEIFPRRVTNVERDDRRARRADRDHAARPRALQASCMEETRNSESLPIRTRLTDEEVGALRRQPLPLPRRRDQGAPVPPVPVRRRRLARHRLHRPHQQGRPGSASSRRASTPTTAAPTTSARSASRRTYEQRAARHHRLRAGRDRRRRARHPHAVAHAAAVSGNNVVLTLDMRLQQVAEDAFGERRGALVAIEPGDRRGARASSPSPASTRTCSSTASTRRTGPSSTARPTSRSTTAPSPASTRRARPSSRSWRSPRSRSASARRSSTINDPGYFIFGDRRFRDSKPGGHGVVDLYKSIVVSSDTYYYQLANDMGIDAIAALHDAASASARAPASTWRARPTGVLPSPEWKQARFKRPEQQKWYPGETISIGIGQGYNAYTPIQLAQAMATLAGERRDVPAAPGRRTSRTRARGERRELRARAGAAGAAASRSTSSSSSARWPASTRRAPARAPSPAPQYTSGGKTGTAQVIAHEAEREVRREEGRRAPPRPFAVHRLRAARQPEDRARGASSRTAASARAPRRRSRAPCSTTTCSASCRPGMQPPRRRTSSRTTGRATDGARAPSRCAASRRGSSRASTRRCWCSSCRCRCSASPRCSRRATRTRRACSNQLRQPRRRAERDVDRRADPAADADAPRGAGLRASASRCSSRGAVRRRGATARAAGCTSASRASSPPR